MSNRPKRWFFPPPATTAYFSKRRQPGMVFRVSRILARNPLISLTNAAVAVATPLNRCTKFRATRSALKMACDEPEIFSSVFPVATFCPSRANFSILIFGDSSRKAISANLIPATASGSRARMSATDLALAGTVASVVASPLPRSSASAARTARRISAAVSSTRTR